MMRCWLSHLTTTHFSLRRCFPAEVLSAIDTAITVSEQAHQAEIRFAVETALPIGHLCRGVSCRERAAEIFDRLGMGETVARNGILIYVLLAERDIEIVADRGFSGKVEASPWQQICRGMEAAFRNSDYGPGSLQAIEAVNDLAVAHFPAGKDNRNELSNKPVLL
jgi:uncharacterized membrane protein